MRKKPHLYTVSIDELPFDNRIIAIMLRAYLSRRSDALELLTPIIREGVVIKFPTPPSVTELAAIPLDTVLDGEKLAELIGEAAEAIKQEEVYSPDPEIDNIFTASKDVLDSIDGAEVVRDMFEIRPNTGFQWLGVAERTETQSLSEITLETIPKTKHELAALLIKKALANGAVESMEIKRIMAEYRIGDKTMNEVKTELGIKPYKKMRTWYWVLPGEEQTGGEDK